ncbi:hypothetical protein EPN15_04325 [Patescibacteria group bacterium]|nr:MAG: hypothetical protein EPN15_04325 [Patescibacteria group bacterium]
MSDIVSIYPIVVIITSTLVVLGSLVFLWITGLEKVNKSLRLRRQTTIFILIFFYGVVFAGMAVFFLTNRDTGVLNNSKHLNIDSIVQEKSIKWTLLNNDLLNTGVNDILIDKDEPTSIYLNTSGGIFKSTDYGGHWRQFNDGIKEEDKSRLSRLENLQSLSIIAGSGSEQRMYQYYKYENKWESLNYFNMLNKARKFQDIKNPDRWNYLDLEDKAKVDNALQMLRGINMEDGGNTIIGGAKIIDIVHDKSNPGLLYVLIVISYMDTNIGYMDMNDAKNMYDKEKFSSRVFLIKNPGDSAEVEDLTKQFPIEFNGKYRLQKLLMPRDKLFILYDGELYNRSVEEKEWHLISNDLIDEKTKITDIKMSQTTPCEIIISNASSKDLLEQQLCFGKNDLPVMYLTIWNSDKNYNAIITNNPYLVGNNERWGVVVNENVRSGTESYFPKEILENESWLTNLISFKEGTIKSYSPEVIYTYNAGNSFYGGYDNKFVLINMSDKKIYLFGLPEEVKNKGLSDFLIDPTNEKRFYISVGGVGVYKGEVE